MKKISIIIPFFNEESGINAFYSSLISELQKIPGYFFELVLIDDGSEDGTLSSLMQLKGYDSVGLKVIELSKNFGKEAALTAGIHNCSGEAVIFMDSDLEHPPQLIDLMIKKWLDGNDVVLGKRASRSNEKFFKRFAVKIFYRIYSKLAQFKTHQESLHLLEARITDWLDYLIILRTERFLFLTLMLQILNTKPL